MDRYYMDYRVNTIVKNLDVSYLAPEMYCEVVVDDIMQGCYTYTYEDAQGRQLKFTFDNAQVNTLYGGFQTEVKAHFERHNFGPAEIVSRFKYIGQQEFDEFYHRG